MKRLVLLALLVAGCSNSCDNVYVARCVEHCERHGAISRLSKVGDNGQHYYCVCSWELKDTFPEEKK